ncbi:MAG: hypothetical protein P1U85_22280 [Verrucomicrobiales bacterium]|nr:hypothetical protein [Verrucomicrobiales bacterium]
MKEESEDIDFWEKPVVELDGDEIHFIVSFLEDEDGMDDSFYPDKAPEGLRKRLVQFEDICLLSYGDEDSPYFEYLGVLWDKTAEVGRLYCRGCDSSGIGEMVPKLDRDAVFPCVLEKLFGGSGSVSLEGAQVEFTDSGAVQVENLQDLNSLVWNPEGFRVFNDELVPRSEIEKLIRRVYEKDNDGYIRESYPTAEDWLERVFG